MRTPRPKMSDMVPHPLPGYAKFGRMVTRREALDIQKQTEALARSIERRKIDDQLTPRLKAMNGWEVELANIAGDLKVTPAAIMLAFRKYDERVAAGNFMFPCFGIEDTNDQEFFDQKTGETYTKTRASSVPDGEKIQLMIEHALQFCEPQKAKALPVPKRHRRTKEAVRKAKARAEGRVKPRPRKGAPSTETRIAATQKSLATRRATLARLKAEPNWQFNVEVRRCEIGIERAERTLATWKGRLQLKDS